MKFIRTTHDENGNVRPGLPILAQNVVGDWPTCSIFMVEPGPRTIGQIVKDHRDYDRQFEYDAPFDYTVPDILEGLANLIRLGLVGVVEEDE